jgi:hypothetical protein
VLEGTAHPSICPPPEVFFIVTVSAVLADIRCGSVPLPPDCPLDPREYAQAWRAWGPGPQWVTRVHGDPLLNAHGLARCGCEVCLARLGEIDPDEHRRALERIAAAAPKRCDVGPAREHLRRLLAGGRTMTSVAVDAGLDRTTLNRVLRADVRRVNVATAEALLAVATGGSPAP